MSKNSSLPWMILDLATAPIGNAAEFIEPAESRDAPSNYKTPEAIEKYQRESFDRDVRMAGADLDLAQITGVAFWTLEHGLKIGVTYGDETAEQKIVGTLAGIIRDQHCAIITYNGLAFDLPMLIRRAAYLGIPMPFISLDRYRSDHLDVYETLTNHGKNKARSLEWYVRRFGLGLEKPLSGEQEARILDQPQDPAAWELLRKSLRHDVLAIARVATLFGLAVFPDEPGAPQPRPDDPVVG
jgi:hypothetical protein